MWVNHTRFVGARRFIDGFGLPYNMFWIGLPAVTDLREDAVVVEDRPVGRGRRSVLKGVSFRVPSAGEA